MKIAFINQPGTPAHPPRGCDSISIWTYQVARRLVNSHEVIVYGKLQSNKPETMTSEGITYFGVSVALDNSLKILRLLDRLNILNTRKPIYASPIYGFGYIWQVASDIKRKKCDIVHIHNYSQFIPIIRMLNPEIKIVLHMHCEWLSQLDKKMISNRLKKTDLIIGCSEYITEKIAKQFPEYKDRCRTVYNGVNLEEFYPNLVEKKPTDILEILFVGRISPEKGVHVLLEAFQYISGKFPNLFLRIIGPEAIPSKEFLIKISTDKKVLHLSKIHDNYFELLRNMITENLVHRVIFEGNIAHEKLPIYYHNADIVVNPSFSEAFGMSLIEAMAMEVPVIASSVGGMTEIVAENQSGILVDAGNKISLANAIVKLLKNRSLRMEMGKAGRKNVIRKFSWKHISESLNKQYQTI